MYESFPRTQGPGGHCRGKSHRVPGPNLGVAGKMDQWLSETLWCDGHFDGANHGKV